jgi:hypothetical protein
MAPEDGSVITWLRDAAPARALFKPYIDGGLARAAFATVPIEFSLHGTSS